MNTDLGSRPSMHLSTFARFILISCFVFGAGALELRADVAAELNSQTGEMAAYRQAAEYSRAHRGLSMVVLKNGRLVFEDYAWGQTAGDAHNLYSGTKSFSCAIAVAATGDGLITFDEPVSNTITEWRSDPRKSKITIRQLLSLTSGIDTGGTGTAPTYDKAIGVGVLHAPGAAFQYGPYPFQVFGELMRRKLAAKGEDPRGYLERRILAPIEVKIDSWRTTSDGNAKMFAGAFLTARDWATYGQLILGGGRWQGSEILKKDLLSECFIGTAANPGYGMTFWLPTNGGLNSKGGRADEAAAKLREIHASGPIFKAAGVGGQKLYIIPSRNLVVVRQASRLPLWGWGFKDNEFLAPILTQEP